MKRAKTKTKINVIILAGGKSNEYEISLKTAQGVLENIDTDKFYPHPLILDRENRFWHFTDNFSSPDFKNPLAMWDALKKIDSLKPCIVFIAMHGEYGEDGRIQSIFDIMEIPYTGSSPKSAALSMEKEWAKAVFSEYGIKTPEFLRISKKEWQKSPVKIANTVINKINIPCVIKPAGLGSSVGIDIVFSDRKLEDSIYNAFNFTDVVIVEKYIKGTEFTAPVLDVKKFGDAIGLPVIKIIPVGHPFFNYRSKYTSSENQEICPAGISDDLEKRIRNIGILAHRALLLDQISRTDVIVDDSGEIYVLETNSLPGLTPESLFPKSAKVYGIEYKELITLLLEDKISKL